MANETNDRRIEKLLNPDIVRAKFVIMGLFLVVYELLRDSITGPLLSFCAQEWKDGKPLSSARYKKKVLGLDPRKKEDPQRGSIAWLKMMSVVDDSDEKVIREVTDARNVIAHEMRHIVSGRREMVELETFFPSLLDLVTKIQRWWFFSVEAPVLSDSNGRISDIHDLLHDLDGLDEDGIVTGSMITMRILCQVAMGNHDESWALHQLWTRIGRT